MRTKLVYRDGKVVELKENEKKSYIERDNTSWEQALHGRKILGNVSL